MEKSAKKYDSSTKHYQALGIIREKIKGPADMAIASFDTLLHISKLEEIDMTYADNHPK